MLRAWRRLPVCAAELQSAEAWLLTLARNRSLDAHRKYRREEGMPEPDLVPTRADMSGAPEPAALRHDDEALLLRSVDRLPGPLRECLTLYLQNHPVADMALRLGISVTAARQRLYRARKLLRDRGDWPGHTAPAIREIRAAMAEVRVVPIPLASGGQESYWLRLPERMPRRPARLQTLRTYVAAHPRGWKVRADLANLLFACGQWEEALIHFAAVLEFQPGRLDEWLRVGEIHRALGNTEGALASYNRALDLTTTEAGRDHVRGWIELTRGSVTAALDRFRRAAAAAPQDPAHLHAIGCICGHSLKLVEAAEAFDRALAIDPRDVVALTGCHDALQHLGRHAEMMERLGRAVELDSSDVLALKLLADHRTEFGFIWGKEGQATRRLILRAIRLSPDTSDAWEPMAHFHAGRGERPQVRALWERYLQRRPGDARALRLFAESMGVKECPSERLELCRRAVDLAPHDFLARMALCAAQCAMHRAEEAKFSVDAVLEEFGDRWEALACEGHLLAAELGQRERGCEIALRAVKLQPDLPAAWQTYAGTLWAAGRRQDALAACSHAWELQGCPRSPHLAIRLAGWWREDGDSKQARAWLARAIEDSIEWRAVAPGVARWWHAQALEAMGNGCQAADLYRAAIATGLLHYDKLADARDALARLR